MKRIGACVNVDGGNCAKCRDFEGLREIGWVGSVVHRVFGAGFNKIFYVNLIVSLYRCRIDPGLVHQENSSFFIPFSVAGDISPVEQAQLVVSGVEKRGSNTVLPDRYFLDVLEYIDVKRKEFLCIADFFRPTQAWEKRSDGWWLLQRAAGSPKRFNFLK